MAVSHTSFIPPGPSMKIDRGRNMTEVIMVTTAFRFAGFMFSPVSMPIAHLEMTVRKEVAMLNPTAPMKKETHCRQESRTERARGAN